jgi:hypothetical protein
LKRLKELKDILTLEEEKNNDLYSMNNNDKQNNVLENYAKGKFKSVLVQTIEKTNTQIQTDKM